MILYIKCEIKWIFIYFNWDNFRIIIIILEALKILSV